VQTLSEAIPKIEESVNAFRYADTADAAEHRALTGSAPGATGAAPAALHATRAPLQSIHNKHVAAEASGAGADGAKGRIDKLLHAVNQRPDDCMAILVQLVAAARSLPEAVWQVRTLCRGASSKSSS
jgi:hypothetical protein